MQIFVFADIIFTVFMILIKTMAFAYYTYTHTHSPHPPIENHLTIMNALKK